MRNFKDLDRLLSIYYIDYIGMKPAALSNAYKNYLFCMKYSPIYFRYIPPMGKEWLFSSNVFCDPLILIPKTKTYYKLYDYKTNKLLYSVKPSEFYNEGYLQFEPLAINDFSMIFGTLQLFIDLYNYGRGVGLDLSEIQSYLNDGYFYQSEVIIESVKIEELTLRIKLRTEDFYKSFLYDIDPTYKLMGKHTVYLQFQQTLNEVISKLIDKPQWEFTDILFNLNCDFKSFTKFSELQNFIFNSVAIF